MAKLWAAAGLRAYQSIKWMMRYATDFVCCPAIHHHAVYRRASAHDRRSINTESPSVQPYLWLRGDIEHVSPTRRPGTRWLNLGRIVVEVAIFYDQNGGFQGVRLRTPSNHGVARACLQCGSSESLLAITRPDCPPPTIT
jgi:hypothetical protein